VNGVTQTAFILKIPNHNIDNLMMDAQDLRERIAQVESKRALLLTYQADPTLSTLSLDIDQALVEMDDLMIEFRQTFPQGIQPPVA
jgi:hypothetical protein